MKKAKAIGPEKPECGSIERNAMLRAINEGEENPFPESEKCTAYWNSITTQKAKIPGCYFELVEADEYEDFLYDQLISGM